MHKVTVIMNTYRDNPQHLDDALRSYIVQEKVETQVVLSIVKGDDKAKEIGVKLADVVVENDDPGIFTQINNAIKEVKGDWVTYASGNDLALPFKCTDEVNACIDNNAVVCYSSFEKVKGMNMQRLSFPKDVTKAELLKGNFISDCAMVRADIFRKHTPFRTDLGVLAYWDLWLRILDKEGPDAFCYNPKPTWRYFVRGGSMAGKRKHNPILQREWQQYRDKLMRIHNKNK